MLGPVLWGNHWELGVSAVSITYYQPFFTIFGSFSMALGMDILFKVKNTIFLALDYFPLSRV